MSGDWIKMRANLWDDPRVAKLCDITDQPEAMVIGGLYWLWATADQHSEDGTMNGLTMRSIDRKAGIKGFSAALISVGWIEDSEAGVIICRFEEHNGASAKKRCQTAKRVAAFKAANAPEQLMFKQGNAPSVTKTLAVRDLEIEKEKEVNLKPISPNGDMSAACAAGPPEGDSDDGKKINGKPAPICPHQAILDLYHAKLPQLAPVRVWNETRRRTLQTLWRTKASELHWTNQTEGIDWFDAYFDFVSQSDFLTGKAKPNGDRPPFLADMEWIIKPQNFTRIIEGKYHQ